MLTIRDDQFRQLAEAFLEQFICRSAELLRSSFPSESSGMDDSALHAYVAKTVGQLRSIGFEYTGDITRALHMLFLIKYGKNQPSLTEDVVVRFKDPSTSIEHRLDVLEQVFIFGSPELES